MSVSTKAEEGRERRLRLRDLAQQVLIRSQERWSTAERRYFGCGRWARTEKDGERQQIELRIGEDGRAGVGGVQVCGSVWVCPQCAAKIRAHRADEIDRAAQAWKDQGKTLLWVTLTVPHDKGMALEPLFDTVVQGFRQLMSGYAWSGRTVRRTKGGQVVAQWHEDGFKDDIGYAGLVRSVEVTLGASGWHPHLHVLLFLDQDKVCLPADTLRDVVKDKWGEQWADVAQRAGLRRPSDVHGVDVQVVQTVQDLAAYLAKVQDEKGQLRGVGNEVARADWKQGRRAGLAPFQLVELAALGSILMTARWEEFRRVTAGRQAITFSAGLRRLCGLEVEVDDQAVAEVEVQAVEALPLDELQWCTVTERVGGRYELLRTAEEGYSQAGWPAAVEAVGNFLQALRAKWAEDPGKTRWGQRWEQASWQTAVTA